VVVVVVMVILVVVVMVIVFVVIVESLVEFWGGSQKSGQLVVNMSTETEDTGEDTANWEDLVHAIMNCRLCRSMNCYGYV
jgi:uncharacterized membrane protein